MSNRYTRKKITMPFIVPRAWTIHDVSMFRYVITAFDFLDFKTPFAQTFPFLKSINLYLELSRLNAERNKIKNSKSMPCCYHHYNVRSTFFRPFSFWKNLHLIHIGRSVSATTLYQSIYFISLSFSWSSCRCWWRWQIFRVVFRKYLQCHVLLKDYKISFDVKLRQKLLAVAIYSVAMIEKIAQCHLYLIQACAVQCTLVLSAAFHSRCQVSSSWLDVAINCNDMVSSNHIQLHCDFIQSIFSLLYTSIRIKVGVYLFYTLEIVQWFSEIILCSKVHKFNGTVIVKKWRLKWEIFVSIRNKRRNSMRKFQ